MCAVKMYRGVLCIWLYSVRGVLCVVYSVRGVLCVVCVVCGV